MFKKNKIQKQRKFISNKKKKLLEDIEILSELIYEKSDNEGYKNIYNQKMKEIEKLKNQEIRTNFDEGYDNVKYYGNRIWDYASNNLPNLVKTGITGYTLSKIWDNYNGGRQLTQNQRAIFYGLVGQFGAKLGYQIFQNLVSYSKPNKEIVENKYINESSLYNQKALLMKGFFKYDLPSLKNIQTLKLKLMIMI